MIVAEFATLNGGEHSMLTLLPLLIRSGWRIKIAFPNQTPSGNGQLLSDLIAPLDVRGITLSTHLPDGTRKSQAQYRRDCADVLKAHQPDIVWCNSLATSRLCGPVTAELSIASVGYLRDIIKLSKKAVEDINRLDRMVAVSQATKNFHVAQGMAAAKISVIHNGVDLQVFKPSRASEESKIKTELGIPHDSPALLFVGQIGMRKGVDVLLDVFEIIGRKFPDCRLIIVGQRHSAKQEAIDYESNLVNRSQSGALSGKIHWLHRRDDMPEIYPGVDLLLHPARQEPLGRVILEAVSCGLPVLTTHVGGSPEILGGIDSFDLLCPVDDVDAMACRAVELLQNADLRQSIGNALREMALRRFDRARCHADLDERLKNMLATA